MTPHEPKVAASDRYTITQAAELLGMHRNTLCDYWRRGLIKCGFRRPTGRKFFTGREIVRFWNAQL